MTNRSTKINSEIEFISYTIHTKSIQLEKNYNIILIINLLLAGISSLFASNENIKKERKKERKKYDDGWWKLM